MKNPIVIRILNNRKSPLKRELLIDKTYTIEVGGKSKTFEQIKSVKNAYIAVDDIEYGHGHKIPLWMFGFLY